VVNLVVWLQPHHQIKHTNVFYEGNQGQTNRAVVLWEEEECILRSEQRGSLCSLQHLLTIAETVGSEPFSGDTRLVYQISGSIIK
jgi:hypothetical protein